MVERDEVLPTPDHLNDIQAAAWPLGGVTAWRSASTNDLDPELIQDLDLL